MFIKQRPYYTATLFILALCAVTLLSGCGKKSQDFPDPTQIAFIEASDTPANTDSVPDNLTQENRVHVYTYMRQNVGSIAIAHYITDYFEVGDLKRYVAYDELQLEFYWYGYLENQPYETVTLTYDPASVSDKKIPLLTLTSSCAGNNTPIYQSIPLAGSGYTYDPYLSPGYTVETFYRDQFQDLINSNQAPKEVVNFDTPIDADYIVKACVKLTLRD